MNGDAPQDNLGCSTDATHSTHCSHVAVARGHHVAVAGRPRIIWSIVVRCTCGNAGQVAVYPALGIRYQSVRSLNGDTEPQLTRYPGFFVVSFKTVQKTTRMICRQDGSDEVVDCSEDGTHPLAAGSWTESVGSLRMAFDDGTFLNRATVVGTLHADDPTVVLPEQPPFIGKAQRQTLGLIGCGREVSASW